MPSPAEDLNDALRDLIDVVRTADLDGVELAGHVRTVAAVADALRPHRHEGVRMQAGLKYPDPAADMGPDVDRGPNDFFPYSPVVGRLNPLAPPVEMWRVAGPTGAEIHGSAVIGAAYNGPPDCVHGGVIAEIMDELLGCVCVTNGIGGFTGTLTVVYRSTTPLSQPLTLRGWHDRSEGRKVFAKGTIHHGDTLCVEAEGIFIRSDALPGGGAGR